MTECETRKSRCANKGEAGENTRTEKGQNLWDKSEVVDGLRIQEAGTGSETASETRTPGQHTRDGNENEISDS